MFRASEARLKLPAEKKAPRRRSGGARSAEDEAALREVLIFLRMRMGHDFSYYKRATVLRRIARRMQVNNTETLSHYLDFLRTHAGEAGALLQDLLISVTNFFRDRETFQALEAHVPALFQNKRPEDEVRVWVAACATGEEAYSIAMLLLEYAGTLEAPPQIQIFATDIDPVSIASAREAVYPETIAADVSDGAAAAFFPKGTSRLSRAARGARAGALCPARCVEGRAVLAARPHLMPQSADLSEPQGAGARV